MFTPGPWRLYENREVDGWPCDVLAGADDSTNGTSIIEGAIFVDSDPAVNAANQRLLVEAPDLDGALLWMLDAMDARMSVDHVLFRVKRDTARAILARVRRID